MGLQARGIAVVLLLLQEHCARPMRTLLRSLQRLLRLDFLPRLAAATLQRTLHVLALPLRCCLRAGHIAGQLLQIP